MRDVVVAAALRTPVGRASRGTFRQTRPDDHAAAVLRALLAKAPKLYPARIVSSGKAHTGIQPHVPSSKETNFVPPVNSEGF